ncbi:MAG: HD-GYP domain-containing protein [Betaproteobacteria bacterium]
MVERNNEGGVVHYVAPDQLRPGLFIYIDLPWFRHPFTLNSFKIKGEDQIRELRALKQARFRYDPDRSDAQVTGAAPLPADLPVAAAESGEPGDGDPVVAEKAARMEQVTVFRERVDQVEKTFVKAASVMRNLNRNLLSSPRETLEEMHSLVGQMVSAFLDHPEVALHVMGEKCGGEDVYYHSLNTSILSMMLAKALGFSGEQGQLLGVGALMHDIGLTEVPDRVLKKRPDEYTKPERELRAMHVEYGVKLGKQIGLPKEVLAVIAQHHEMADGSGYPLGLKLDKMSPLARVVSLVNFYDNLCNPVDINQAMTPHEALSFMFAQRRAKFDPKVLQLMIRCLGVYPPGSIVKLSNEAIAMVVSVNTQKPLRPWVMLYDPSVPKEEAIILDLEKETDIQIGKAIRPALLPTPVVAYLNPRKRITYFFDGKATPSRNGG